MKKLDILTFPLHQNALIEASAGTGKTYTISNLYLRLILGHQCQALSVAQILILTFTNAATAELKDRILARIRLAWRDFVVGRSDDDFIQTLITEVQDKAQAQQRLLIASQEMDLASVFTIHGFCQRVLSEHAFESGAAWQETLSLDDSPLLKKATSDYWRIRVADLPEDTLRWYVKQCPKPENLIQQVRPVLFRDIGEQQPEQLLQQWQTLQKRYDEALQELKKWWHENQVSTVLADADLNARAKISKPDFLANMAAFAAGTIGLPDLGSDGWLTLSPEKVEKARKKSSAEIDLGPFQRFEDLAELEAKLTSARQQYFFWDALLFVRQHLQAQKLQNAELSPDDLLARLYSALSSESISSAQSLKALLQDKYPIALVDEFQDTDETQFAIFKLLFEQKNEQQRALVMIGDPKQAIYSFRGGDIHTYLSARHFVPEHSRYTLSVNWRSHPDLVSAVNQLFSQSQTGFMHADMPFYAVDAGKSAKSMQLGSEQVPALQASVLPDAIDKKGAPAPLKWGQSSVSMAQVCANQISTYLKLMRIEGEALNASDVCVLVRDRFEAELIQQALRQRQIDSVFLRKDSVLKSPVAYSLLLLLKAIVGYKSETAIKAALLDSLFAYQHEELQALNQNVPQWQTVLQRFNRAYEIWCWQGVMAALEYVFQAFGLYKRIMAHNPEHHRCVTDLRHLNEILQFQSGRIEGKSPLILWFEERIANPDLLASDGIEGTQWRLDTDQNLVQISTIHASKGLQYPVVMMPFVSRFKDHTGGFYHDEEKGLQYNIEDDEALKVRQQQERLAEDIRLFYVAITRAELHCWLGVWNNPLSARSNASGFTSTALGRLLDFDAEQSSLAEQIVARLQQRLTAQSVRIALVEKAQIDDILPFESAQHQPKPLSFKQLQKGIKQNWLLTSYSAISRTRQTEIASIAVEEELKTADEASPQADDLLEVLEAEQENLPFETELPMRFRFTKGASAGSFLHEVLEHCLFDQPETIQTQCLAYAEKYSIAESDIPDIRDWLVEALQSPLFEGANSLTLWQLPAQQQLAEMEFYLPLNQVNVKKFNELLQAWLPDMHGHYQLNHLNGMLKGYLDLIYLHQGRFYVADYKSNFLGESFADYQPEQLHHVMLHHDYYLQAVLYSVALHRYLKNRITHYNYEQHIGGAQYLFLRGMCKHHPGYGVFTVTPPKSLILAMDALFDGVADNE